ncbi:MAG: hypothetical protein KF826_08120 [Xanthobacteraceae bacterium]|nr:hypothetical protein [Xanthobacteraceae bacterium]MBX3534303.1 hypothetical protein [Xanthobacteraceae bacterium]MBX3550108.1 hypothetical protein [Xanthobacteraceae bacterium]MCW5677454.1 hypothetical protein [Xanthobacteraceae bacterium]
MRALRPGLSGLFFAVSFAVAFAQGGAPVGNRSQPIEALLGRWCSSFGTYTFTETKLVVAFNNGTPSRTLEVLEVRQLNNAIDVRWKPPYVNTVFSNFSSDNQTMEQPPTTDGGPLRKFRRC